MTDVACARPRYIDVENKGTRNAARRTSSAPPLIRRTLNLHFATYAIRHGIVTTTFSRLAACVGRPPERHPLGSGRRLLHSALPSLERSHTRLAVLHGVVWADGPISRSTLRVKFALAKTTRNTS